MKKILSIILAVILSLGMLAGCGTKTETESKEPVYTGYVTLEGLSEQDAATIMAITSHKTGIPLEKIYGVVTFYAQFSLNPKGKYKISVCLGTACYVKGAGDIFDKFSERLGIGADECTEDGKFSLTACRCIGACGLAPVLTVNEEVYGRLTVDDVDGILEKYGFSK